MLGAELFSFLERISDAAFPMIEVGEICCWNNSAERLFGYPVSEAPNRTCSYESLRWRLQCLTLRSATFGATTKAAVAS